ncbi:hypothetical protein HPB51_027499 [Rhipicephalus microplus]|uniref:CCHC-type domain-containing protein n=1 Tax=Rhipicephalus microplus TaxID=6941 RepID=A0A9J6CZW9_RHIMP|nr:hypothetical protein HPB51_027499 [Rhipicephalus microplus]
MAASTKTSYDPSTMQWVDIEVAETREDPIPGEDEYLQIMVRQLQEKLAKMKPRGSTAAAQPQARKTGSTTAACVESPRQLVTWKPTHTPRIRSDELVIVLKPKITMDLHAAFGPGGIGTAVQRFTGSTTNAGISVWPVWDQNIVVVGVKTESLASKLIGDITLTIGDRQVPFQGHLKSAGETCKGVVTVADNETSESLRRKLEWIDGEILYVRKLGTSNVAVVTFKGRRVPRFIHYCCENVPVRYYKKTVPACYRCGTVGHRPDACPNPDNQRCIHCGAKVELTLEGPAKHDCQPECLICGENHFTGSAQCVGKFRKAWKPALTQWQHGLKNKQEEPSAPLRTDEKAKPMHNKPKRIKAPAGQKSRPSTFGAEDFPSLANPPRQVSNWVGVSSQSPTTTTASLSNSKILKQLEAMKKRIETLERENRALKASQATSPPPPSKPVAMHTSDCSDDEQDNQSDVSGNTSVSKTVVGASNDIEGRLSRLEAKLEEQSKMILEQTKLPVQDIIPQQRNLSVQAAMQDLKQSILPIFTASVLQTVQNWLTLQLDQLKTSIKTTKQRRRKIVHRNLANSESENNIAQSLTNQTESPMPLQALTLAAVAKTTPPQ